MRRWALIIPFLYLDAQLALFVMELKPTSACPRNYVVIDERTLTWGGMERLRVDRPILWESWEVEAEEASILWDGCRILTVLVVLGPVAPNDVSPHGLAEKAV